MTLPIIADANDPIIDQIIKSFSDYNIRDIREIGKLADAANMDFVIAEFTLCSCLIDQLSGFRYNSDEVGCRYRQFVRDYLPMYNPKELYNDLRNRLVHNYSIGEYYQLTRNSKAPQPPIGNNITRLFLDTFLSDLENAVTKYISELKTNIDIRTNALKWYKKYRIIG